MKKGIFKYKLYAHIDKRLKVDDVIKYIKNPDKIKKHSFYPFILDQHKSIKFNKEEKRKPPKIRKIMFSSHIDRYIYQYYNYLINEKYNIYVKRSGINKCCIAYRTNLPSNYNNNIAFAKDVFKFLISIDDAYILVGDFKDYFDNLNHKHLKRMLCKVLGKKCLPDDYYDVFKNITRYSYFDLNDICNIKGLKRRDVYEIIEKINEDTSKKELVGKLETLMTIDEVKKYKRFLKHNKEFGIPQGSSISSVLANVYMIDADKKINEYVTGKGGIYKRYSDDFIITIPKINKEDFKKVITKIRFILINNGNPTLQDKKTNIFEYKNETIKNVNKEFIENGANIKDELEFLGFSFNGNIIKIRDKSLSKFYYRMYRKIKTIAKKDGISSKGNKISNKELYRLYSIYGKDKGKGNFITYAERCENTFKEIEEYYVSYKKRFIRKLKNRYNKSFKKYKKLK